MSASGLYGPGGSPPASGHRGPAARGAVAQCGCTSRRGAGRFRGIRTGVPGIQRRDPQPSTHPPPQGTLRQDFERVSPIWPEPAELKLVLSPTRSRRSPLAGAYPTPISSIILATDRHGPYAGKAARVCQWRDHMTWPPPQRRGQWAGSTGSQGFGWETKPSRFTSQDCGTHTALLRIQWEHSGWIVAFSNRISGDKASEAHRWGTRSSADFRYSWMRRQIVPRTAARHRMDARATQTTVSAWSGVAHPNSLKPCCLK